MAYGVFESTNMKSTRGAARIMDAVAAVDTENGTFGYIEELATGEDVIYNFHVGTKDGVPVFVVDQPAWTEDESKRSNQRKDNFIVKAGTPFRIREVAKLDEFAINEACVTVATQGLLDNDVYLTVNSTTGKLDASASPTSGVPFEAVIMRKRVTGATLVTAAHEYGYSRMMYEAQIRTLA